MFDYFNPGNSAVGGAAAMNNRKLKRFPDQEEKIAAHYNMACCLSRLDDAPKAVDALRTAFTLGYNDFSAVKKDDSLKGLAGLDALIAEFKWNPFAFLPFKKK